LVTASPVIVVHGGAGDWPEGTEAGVIACITAAEAGLHVLSNASALDAVVTAVRVLEDAPACNAGTGAALTRDETLELDASVMDGSTLASGAVACLPPFLHPIDVARSILEDRRYHLLVGEGAAKFAVSRGFAPCDSELMIVDQRRADLKLPTVTSSAGNTVGAVALDMEGRLASATSTGGVAGTDPGRVGDVPIVGAGTYANSNASCSCTGDGEAFTRACAAFWAVENAGDDPQAASSVLLARVHDQFRGRGGLIILNKTGKIGIGHSMPFMPHAVARAEEPISARAKQS
jgi:beta-aspartyl-peptidase (threonine type)